MTEKLCEMMKKKQAMEYAKLLQECEEGKQRDLGSQNEANEEVDAKDQGLKITIEEILTFMTEMNRGQREEEVKARTDDEHRRRIRFLIPSNQRGS